MAIFMKTIIVSDVFGVTPALVKLSEKLGADTIIDPYKGEYMGFKDEAQAYSCFVATVGLDSYVSKLLTILASFNDKVTLVGFSVGASAIWISSTANERNVIEQAFCFYGSQIRNFTQIEPCFKVNLLFPKWESHFDVAELIEKLKNPPHVNTTQVDYLHGFMNYYSSNFNKSGYTQHMALLRETINQ